MSIQQDKFAEIANAIRTKKGTTNQIIANDFANEILSIPSGGGAVGKNDITFYDYDGTILHSYTIDEFAAMSELPPSPSHDGLVFQSWNWSLADIKAAGMAVNVGATYTTASGKSEFDLTFDAVTGLDITMRIYNVTAGNTITVEWGDGTSSNAPTTTVGEKVFTHTYGSYGNYTAAVDSTGDYYPCGTTVTPFNIFNKAPSHNCTAIRLSDRCTSIDNHAFRVCYGLQSVTIPSSVTSIGVNAFLGCYGLQSVTIPNSVTNIGTQTFSTCYSLQSVTIPNSVTNIGTNAFYNCYSLQSVTIPSSVTNIGAYAFYNCFSVRKYTMQLATPPTLANVNAFTGISQLCIIEVPKGSLNAYRSATNWATYADHMREAEI